MSTLTPKMVKVRIISQRYGGPGDFEKNEATGETISLQDKPLINRSTGRPLINGGSFARPDPTATDPKKRIRQWMPGEVLEMPEDEALDQIRMTPDVLELESIYQARMERIAKKSAPAPGAAFEIAAAMEQTDREHAAAQRMKALHAEKQVREIAEAAAALHPSHDKDRIIATLEELAKTQQAQLAAQQEQLARLEEIVTRPAAQGAQT